MNLANGDRVALCFFVDALGWEMAQEHGTFRKVAPHAYRQRTVLGYSCAAQPTILTGMMPSEHGHWGMFYRSESSALAPLRTMRFLPTVVTGHRRFRRRLLQWHRRKTGFTGYYNFYRIPFELFSTFDIVEKKDIFAPAAFDPGVSSIFDHLVSEGIPFRSWSWKSGLDTSLAELENELREKRTRFYLLYTPHIDAFLHGKVDDDAAVLVCEVRGDANRPIRYVIDAAIEAPQYGGSHADLNNRPGDPCEFHDVADGVLVLDEDEQAGYHVLDEILSAEPDRDADNRERSDDGSDRHTPHRQTHHDGDAHDRESCDR